MNIDLKNVLMSLGMRIYRVDNQWSMTGCEGRFAEKTFGHTLEVFYISENGSRYCNCSVKGFCCFFHCDIFLYTLRAVSKLVVTVV